MGTVRAEDVVGYFVEQECVCCDCANAEEKAAASQNEIITLTNIENGDRFYFCGRCEKQLG